MGTEFHTGEKQLRQVPGDLKFQSPIEVASRIMKVKNQQLAAKDKEFYESKQEDNKAFASIAMQVFALNKTLERYKEKLANEDLKPLSDELRITLSNLERSLQHAGVTITDFTGDDIDDSVLDMSEVIGWVYHEQEKESVVETYEPLIRRDEDVINMAKIIGGSRSTAKERIED